jgi:hypothetical protein
MMRKLFAVTVAALTLGVLANGMSSAGDKDRTTEKDSPAGKDVKLDRNTHMGKFVSAKGETLVIDAKGRELTLKVAPGAKVIGLDGKDGKLESFTKGQMLRVTTQDGSPDVAVRIELAREKSDTPREKEDR